LKQQWTVGSLGQQPVEIFDPPQPGDVWVHAWIYARTAV
jgi:hypothetical protein